jgi:hypothetical protein
MGQTESHFLSDLMSDRKKFSPTLRNIYKKQHGARPCMENMQFIFFVPPNVELEVKPVIQPISAKNIYKSSLF